MKRQELIDSFIAGQIDIEELEMLLEENSFKAMTNAEKKDLIAKKEATPIKEEEVPPVDPPAEKAKAEVKADEPDKVTRESIIEKFKSKELSTMATLKLLKEHNFATLTMEERSNGAVATPVKVNKKVATTKSSTSTNIMMGEPAFKMRTRRGNKNKYWNFLFYADYGVGKTTLFSTLEDIPNIQGDILLGNVEGGDEVISLDSNIVIADLNNYQQIARFFDFLVLHVKYRDEDNVEELIKLQAKFFGMSVDEIDEPYRFYYVCLDSITEIQKYCMYHILGTNIGEVPLDILPDQPLYKEWGQSREMIQRLLREFRNLPINTIFLASRKYDKDETNKFYFMPALPGQLASDILGFMDAVGFYVTEVNGAGMTTRVLYLDPHPQFKAKNRFRNFTEGKIENPTMTTILEARAR